MEFKTTNLQSSEGESNYGAKFCFMAVGGVVMDAGFSLSCPSVHWEPRAVVTPMDQRVYER